MRDVCSLIWLALIGLFRSRASLQAEILTLRHQLHVLRRRSPQQLTFTCIDRLVFAGLYRLALGVLDALKIVRPGTVNPLASCRLPSVLALEIKTAQWAGHPHDRFRQGVWAASYSVPREQFEQRGVALNLGALAGCLITVHDL
jgi:hypothetical protein